MARVISIVNQKGGTGKSACTGIRISEIKYFTVERVKSGKTEVIFGEK